MPRPSHLVGKTEIGRTSSQLISRDFNRRASNWERGTSSSSEEPSYSHWLGGPVSELAGTIYKGNLRTGEGDVLVERTGEPIAGLSYDPRTDYLYTVTNFRATDTVPGSAVLVYDATTGDPIDEIFVGFNHRLNDIIVTAQGGVYYRF